MSRARPEEALHRAVAQYLAVALPVTAFWFHPANESKRSPRQGATLKALGMAPGLPDIFIHFGGRAWAIELKAPKGRVSPEQQSVFCRLSAAGCPWAVCRSLDEVEGCLRGWGIPLRARAALAPAGGEREVA